MKNNNGRPTREQANEKALAKLKMLGIDPSTVDPFRIIAAIAADEKAPSSSRVRACQMLIGRELATLHECRVGIKAIKKAVSRG